MCCGSICCPPTFRSRLFMRFCKKLISQVALNVQNISCNLHAHSFDIAFLHRRSSRYKRLILFRRMRLLVGSMSHCQCTHILHVQAKLMLPWIAPSSSTSSTPYQLTTMEHWSHCLMFWFTQTSYALAEKKISLLSGDFKTPPYVIRTAYLPYVTDCFPVHVTPEGQALVPRSTVGGCKAMKRQIYCAGDRTGRERPRVLVPNNGKFSDGLLIIDKVLRCINTSIY